MSESKVIKNHPVHLAELTAKADAGGLKEVKALIDYLVMYKSAK